MDVSITGAGAQGNIEAQVDPSQQAVRTTIRPLEHTFANLIGGHYRLTAISGTIAASLAANSELFGFRWTDPTKVVIIKKIQAGLGVTGTPGAAQGLDLEAIRATSWTANYSANQTAITPATSAQKLRTSNMSGSTFATAGSIMICTTAGMTGSTKTNDTAGMAYAMFPGATAGAGATYDLFNENAFGEHPIVLGVNEGIVIRNPTAYPATSTYKLGVTIAWTEVASY